MDNDDDTRGIDICPTCGSDEIRAVRRTLKRAYKGRRYTVPNLCFHECPRCGEQVFDPEAVRRIEARSPAFAKRHDARRSA
jgi:YgiT-type zinc finger domain-containing protein